MSQITEESTSRFAQLKVDGKDMRIHYNEAGPSDGIPLFMVHGGGPGASGWSNFSRNVEPFAEKGFRVVLPDLPGFNKSDEVVVSGSRGKHCAQAVAALMDHLGVKSAHFVGNSLGGITSMYMALDYADRMQKLCLMGPGGLGYSLFQVMPMQGIHQLFGVYRNPNRDDMKRLVQSFIFDQSKITDELIDGRYQAMMRSATHLKNFVETFEKNPASLLEDMTARLGNIKAQTLVIWGRDDRFVPLDHALKLLWAIPNAKLTVYGRCGHWAQWELADEFNRSLLDFLTH